VAAIVRALVEGNSLRVMARLTGTSKNTVTELLCDLGAHCKNYHDSFVRDVACKRVQCNEIWACCGAKEKNATEEQKAEGWGNVWTWTALCQNSKLSVF
jgi:DNA-binding transcriptional ArsR family regulator